MKKFWTVKRSCLFSLMLFLVFSLVSLGGARPAWGDKTSSGHWHSLQSTSTTARSGTMLTPDGQGHLYGFVDGNFFRFDISSNNWVNLTDINASDYPNGGRGIAHVPGKNAVYNLQGQNTSNAETDNFRKYSIGTDNWVTSPSNAPAPAGKGSSLVHVPSDDALYALRGAGTDDFWKYDLNSGTWSTAPGDLPGTVNDGGTLIYREETQTFYALAGGSSTNFYKRKKGASWSSLQNIPVGVGNGGSISYPGFGDTIYLTVGLDQNKFYGYSISRDDWTSLTNVPKTVDIGGDLVSAGGVLYAIRGNSSTDFYRYNPANIPLEFGPAVADQSRNEDTDPWKISLGHRVSDTDDATLKWSVTGAGVVDAKLEHGTYRSGGDDTLVLEPVPDANGTSILELSVTDGTDVKKQTLSVTLNPVDDEPRITRGFEDITLREDGDSVVINHLEDYAEDPDEGDEFLWSKQNFPSTFDADLFEIPNETGSDTLTVTPLADANGSETLILGVREFLFQPPTDTTAINVTVKPTNDPPVISGLSVQTRDEDADSWTLSLGDNASDVDGDALKWTVNGADTLVKTRLTNNAYKSNGADTVTFIPRDDANGTGSVTFRLGDGSETVNQSILVHLNPVNDTPTFVASIPDQDLQENGSSQSLSLKPYGEDIDEGDTLTWTVSDAGDTVQASLEETATTTGADTLTLDPLADKSGTETIRLKLSDGSGTISQSVDVIVGNVKDAPMISVLSDQSRSEDADSWSLSLKSFGSDPDGDSMQWSVNGGDTLVKTTLAKSAYTSGGADTVTFIPRDDANGTAGVTFQLGDGQDTTSQSITVQLSSRNDTPTFFSSVPDQDLQENGSAQSISLKPYGEDIDEGDTLTWTVSDAGDTVQASLEETATTTGADTLTLDPLADKSGTETIRLKLSDGSGTISQSIDAKVSGQNRPPVASDTAVQVRGEGQTQLVSPGSDPEGTSLKYSFLSLPSHGRVNTSGDTITYRPTLNRTVSDSFVYQATDANGGSDTAHVSVRISRVIPQQTISDPTTDADTLQAQSSNGSVSLQLGTNNNASSFTSGALQSGDTLLTVMNQHNLSSMNKSPWNPAYEFESIDEVRTTIEGANDDFFGSANEPVNEKLTSISLWKNDTGVSSNYLGGADTLTEDAQVTIGNVTFDGEPDELRIAKLLESPQEWHVISKEPTVTGSPGDYSVTFEVSSDASRTGSGFSIFTVITGPGTSGSASETVVYPNPFKPNDGNSSTGQYGIGSGEGINFGTSSGEGFPSGTTVRIYTIKGERVDRVTTSTGGLIRWNARTRNGEPVASGVYLYRIEVPDRGTQNGKLMIVR